MKKLLTILLASVSISSSICLPSKAIITTIDDPIFAYANPNSQEIQILDQAASYAFHNHCPRSSSDDFYFPMMAMNGDFIMNKSVVTLFKDVLETSGTLIEIFNDKENSEEVIEKAGNSLELIRSWIIAFIALPVSICGYNIFNMQNHDIWNLRNSEVQQNEMLQSTLDYYTRLKVDFENKETRRTFLINFIRCRKDLETIIRLLRSWGKQACGKSTTIN